MIEIDIFKRLLIMLYGLIFRFCYFYIRLFFLNARAPAPLMAASGPTELKVSLQDWRSNNREVCIIPDLMESNNIFLQVQISPQ